MSVLMSKDYGKIEYHNEDILAFPDGIFGFSELKSFIPLALEDQGDSSILLLLAKENPSIAFAVIDPFMLDPNYAPSLLPEELAYMGVSSENKLSFYAICVLRDNYKDNTVNLKCPIVINPENRTGMQVILSDSNYKYSHKLSEFV